ncbi:hypothetical protein [Alicyclobacillus dauci]|uniref:Uncharacterized protein n=1 Tax=Alicyclobacillus dauci TaxID=1475485 RepID=A0ABY6Z6H0_9BACL|nr:hypothetical protein [Alicyclobacillus dauci]WAH38118.1 hypothetical protein NZD86_06415 [Alicyclobacillus dauci]
MNIIEAALRVGQQLKTIDEGKELVETYDSVKQSLSAEYVSTFRKASKGMRHFFSFPYALALLEGNSVREDLPEPFKDEIKIIIGSKEVNRLSMLSEKVGQNLEQMLMEAMNPQTTPKTFGRLNSTIKLQRALQDFRFTLQRSGIIQQLFTFLDPKTRQLPPIVGQFEKHKSTMPHPFSRDIRRTISEMASAEQERRLLTTVYVFSVLLDLVKQMVFESLLNEVIEIPENCIDAIAIRHAGHIRVLSMRLSPAMMGIMSWHGHFAQLRIAGLNETAIVTRKNLRWGQSVSDGFRLRVQGYFYPDTDGNILKAVRD